MAKCKIKIKRIENSASRKVTFAKRKNGLMKKAHDLTVLCDAQVAVIVFSDKGKQFQFSSPSMQNIMERYNRHKSDSNASSSISGSSLDGNITSRVVDFVEMLKNLRSTLMGNCSERLSLKDLILLEQQMHATLGYVRAEKEQRFMDEIQHIYDKVTATQKRMCKKSNTGKGTVELTPLELAGSQNSSANRNEDESCCAQHETQAHLSTLLDLRAIAHGNYRENTLAAKKHPLLEDLNKLPTSCQEVSSED